VSDSAVHKQNPAAGAITAAPKRDAGYAVYDSLGQKIGHPTQPQNKAIWRCNLGGRSPPRSPIDVYRIRVPNQKGEMRWQRYRY
jgi:hypothetical protein